MWFAGCSDRNEGIGGPKDGVAIAFSLDCGALSASVGAAQTGQPAQVAPIAQTAAQAAQTALATRAAVPIANGTTVRIVALHAGDALGSTPAASATYYVTGEETADGHKRATLAPCTVTNDATGAVTAYSDDPTKVMRLKAGEYDFYAFSPALPLKSDGKSVDVYHGMDFAASATAGVVVKSDGSTTYPDPMNAAPATKNGAIGSGAVELQTLGRRCALVSFSVEPKTATAFKKLTISSVQLSKMTDQPAANTSVNAAITPGGNTCTFTFPSSAFKPGSADNLWSFESPVLPKIEDTYGLTMTVLYNDNTTPVVLATAADQIPAMAYLAGYRYSYTLRVKGANLQLILTVSDWNDADAWEDPDGIGAYPGTTIVVGEWTECVDDNTGIGAVLNPEFTTSSSWSDSTNTNDDIGVE